MGDVTPRNGEKVDKIVAAIKKQNQFLLSATLAAKKNKNKKNKNKKKTTTTTTIARQVAAPRCVTLGNVWCNLRLNSTLICSLPFDRSRQVSFARKWSFFNNVTNTSTAISNRSFRSSDHSFDIARFGNTSDFSLFLQELCFNVL